MSSTRSGFPKAPATESPAWRDATLVLCAHGVRGGVGIAAAHAAAIAQDKLFAQVEACCLKGSPTVEDAFEAVPPGPVYLVPLLMAEGYSNELLVERARAAAERSGATLMCCRPVGAHPGLAALIAEQALARCRARGWRESETNLLLIGHGTPRHPDSSRSLEDQARRIAAASRFAEIGCAFLDAAPSVSEALSSMTAPRTVAVGFFADAGPHGVEDVEALLSAEARETDYAGPLGCDPALRRVILDQVRAAMPVAAGDQVAGKASLSRDSQSDRAMDSASA